MWPLGCALPTAVTPMVPPAPGRFSTTIGWLTCFDTCSSTIRPTMSLAAPAANGTIAWIVRSGQGGDACAAAACGSANNTAPARCQVRNDRFGNAIIVFSRLRTFSCRVAGGNIGGANPGSNGGRVAVNGPLVRARRSPSRCASARQPGERLHATLEAYRPRSSPRAHAAARSDAPSAGTRSAARGCRSAGRRRRSAERALASARSSIEPSLASVTCSLATCPSHSLDDCTISMNLARIASTGAVEIDIEQDRANEVVDSRVQFWNGFSMNR